MEVKDDFVVTARVLSPIGMLEIVGSKSAIRSVTFLNEGVADLGAESVDAIQNDWFSDSLDQLNEYFSGSRTEFSVPLDPIGTDFQKRVWAELQQIKFGETISYQELAERLGDPKSVRAVGGANGKNPIAIIVPCHRVIGASGKLVGYSGGLERKKWLLRHELEFPKSEAELF